MSNLKIFRRGEICAPKPFDDPLVANFIYGLILEGIDKSEAVKWWEMLNEELNRPDNMLEFQRGQAKALRGSVLNVRRCPGNNS